MPDFDAVAPLFLTGLPASGADAAFERFARATPLAGFLLFRRDFVGAAELGPLIGRLREWSAPRRPLIAVDEEGGFVSQLAPDDLWLPGARVLGRAAGDDEVARLGETLGRRLAEFGVDLDFAPVLDVDLEPVNPVIGPRAFGDDPAAVARLGATFAQALSTGGVVPCAKHFPGHGDTRLDSHLELPTCHASREELERLHLPPFRAAVRDGVPVVMVSHVHYEALDTEPRPATLSAAALALLRRDLGFEGVAVSDAMEMKAVAERYGPGEAAVAALEAGIDLLLYGSFTPEVEVALAAVAEAAASGRLTAERLAASKRRLAALSAHAQRLHERGRRRSGPEPVDLEDLCRRSLRWVGPAPAQPEPAAELWVVENARPGVPAIGELLAHAGRPGERLDWSAAAALELPPGARVVAVLERRTPPSESERALLRRACAAAPTWLVALGQDAFLADFDRAEGRLSACDPTPAMRAAVAAALAAALPPAAAPAPRRR